MTKEKVEFVAADASILDKICKGIAAKYGKLGNMSYEMAYRLLLITCMEKKVFIGSIADVNNSIDKILKIVHNLAPSHALNVASLKKIINDLPESTPVVIDYLKDVNWQHTEAFWEAMEIKESQIAGLDESQKKMLKHENGKYYLETFNPVVSAFHAMVSRDPEGKKFLYIHAHY